MKKLFLAIIVFVFTFQDLKAEETKVTTIETDKLLEWVFWTTFSQTYLETDNYWQAESAALDAESTAEEVINADKWLTEIAKKETKKNAKCTDDKYI